MKRGIARILLILTGGLLALGILEVILTAHQFLSLHGFGREGFVVERQAVINEIPKGPNLDRAFESTLIIHPLFGYTYNPKNDGINNFGFNTYDIMLSESGYSIADARPRKDLLIVGIFGGSFAEHVGWYGDYLEKKLKKAFPTKHPAVMSFGVGGHALPQAAIIYTYFREMFDVAVFVDGLNEVWNAVENNRANAPPEHAKAYHFHYKLSVNELTPERFMRTARIIKLKQNLAEMTGLSLLAGLKNSLVVHYLWKFFADRWKHEIEHQSLKIAESYKRDQKFFNVDDRRIMRHAAGKWAGYHRLLRDIAVREGALDLHYLQPNPFVPDSKEMTPEEVSLVTNSYPIKEYVLGGYPLLRELAADSGVEDLSYLYKHVKESIWIDSAHPNQKGVELFLDKVFEAILKSRDQLAAGYSKERGAVSLNASEENTVSSWNQQN